MRSTYSSKAEGRSSRYVLQLVLHTISGSYVARPQCPAAYSLYFAHEPVPENGTELRARAAMDSEAGPPTKFCSRWDAVRHRREANDAREKNHPEDQRYAAGVQEREVWPSI